MNLLPLSLFAIVAFAASMPYSWGQTLRDQYLENQDSKARENSSCEEHKKKFTYALPSLEWGYGFRDLQGRAVSGSGLAFYRIDNNQVVYALIDESCPDINEFTLGKVDILYSYKDGYQQQFLMEGNMLCQYRKFSPDSIEKKCFSQQKAF